MKFEIENQKGELKMAKLTKEELLAKINEKLADNSELAVELMEDVTDSMEEAPVTNEYETKFKEYTNGLNEYNITTTEGTNFKITPINCKDDEIAVVVYDYIRDTRYF